MKLLNVQKKILAKKIDLLENAIFTLSDLRSNLVAFSSKENEVEKYECKDIDDIVERIQDLQMTVERFYINEEN